MSSIFNKIFDELVNNAGLLQKLVNDVDFVYNERDDEQDEKCSTTLKNDIKFTYDEKGITPERKKEIISEKVTYYTKLYKGINEWVNNDATITFKFNDDEVYYFTWDKDNSYFVTVEPNGDKYYLDIDTKNLVEISGTDTCKCNKDSKPKQCCALTEKDCAQKSDVKVECEKPFKDLGDDSNLAFNLKNALTKKKESEPEKTPVYFDYITAVNRRFKQDVIDPYAFWTEFDGKPDENPPYQIRFTIAHLLDVPDGMSLQDVLYSVYHNESENLDKFVDMIKEKYNFSIGGWDVIFNDTDKNVVDDIRFVFVF